LTVAADPLSRMIVRLHRELRCSNWARTTVLGTQIFTGGDPLREISHRPASAVENTDDEAAANASATGTAAQTLTNAFTSRSLTQTVFQQSELS
jgi:hypothetical protein